MQCPLLGGAKRGINALLWGVRALETGLDTGKNAWSGYRMKKVGERIKAYVVLKADIKGITGYDLIKWCRKNLVAYKVPQYIEFRDMLPKSKVGKLLRREIRDEEKRRAEA